ncbi:mannitol dehydrogenase family protein [Nocardiopsis sediminis]|uniref:Mannitol dehydrogenase family protein n=1 Tax=Nocardiopsis sediminis TaxID=1778267 RepID=A0ABV8FW60_9ACTN
MTPGPHPPRLGAASTPAGTLVHHRGGPETGIVHLGLGNFHRAHQAVYTAQALAHTDGPWGILGVASRSPAVADALRAQDLRYSVLEVSPEGTRASVPAVHTGVLVAAQEPGAVLDALAAPATAIVTLTVTEHGYTFAPGSGGLDLANPLVRADLAGTAPPRTTIGLLARGLLRRARTHGRPVTVLSCDNLVQNGATTRRLLREFAAELPAAEGAELLAYLDTAAFPNSMVDRIVPATTDAYRATAARLLGARDEVPVPAEPFTMWALEDRFAAGRPAWESAGAVFTDEVDAYELIKLRLLNGTHSLLAYLGALHGCATIPEAIARPEIAAAADRVLRTEYLPTVRVPGGMDIERYIAELSARWSNFALGHKTSQVGSDGSVKLRQRVPEPALAHLAAGRMPHHLALTLAAYLCCIAPPPGFDPGPAAAAMSDPARATLTPLAGGSARDFAAAVLRTGLLGAGLAEHTAFADRVAELITVITTHGPLTAARETAEAAEPDTRSPSEDPVPGTPSTTPAH